MIESHLHFGRRLNEIDTFVVVIKLVIYDDLHFVVAYLLLNVENTHKHIIKSSTRLTYHSIVQIIHYSIS